MLGKLSFPISLNLYGFSQYVVAKIIESDKEADGLPGRLKHKISAKTLEELHGVGFSWEKISKIFGVSRCTIPRRLTEYALENVSGFSTISDQELCTRILDYFERHNRTTGRTLLVGYVRNLGIRLHRSRIRKVLVRLDPRNTALR